jgi:xanthine dehydrogenase YagT iron-sulfur-binding subunit
MDAVRRKQAHTLTEHALDAEQYGDRDTAEHQPKPTAAPFAQIGPADSFDIVLTVNQVEHHLIVDARTTLLDALRDRLHLTGTKRGCDLGQCGTCTVLLGGRRINACLTLAVMARNSSITTIEGLSRGGELHPMQQGFIDQDAFQCGYCTPGQIMSAVGFVAEHRELTDDAIRDHMSGNICRCGAYSNIVAAIRDAAGQA